MSILILFGFKLCLVWNFNMYCAPFLKRHAANGYTSCRKSWRSPRLTWISPALFNTIWSFQSFFFITSLWKGVTQNHLKVFLPLDPKVSMMQHPLPTGFGIIKSFLGINVILPVSKFKNSSFPVELGKDDSSFSAVSSCDCSSGWMIHPVWCVSCGTLCLHLWVGLRAARNLPSALLTHQAN